jgi:hypothetical protein
MNAHEDKSGESERVAYRVRFTAEWDRQFAALPKADRDLIIADPSGVLAEGLSYHVEKILSAVTPPPPGVLEGPGEREND